MTKLRWERAKKRPTDLEVDEDRKRRRLTRYADTILARGRPTPAEKVFNKASKTAKKAKHKSYHHLNKSPFFPAHVTVGNPDGTLKILTFNSRHEADAAGFEWVGRRTAA